MIVQERPLAPPPATETHQPLTAPAPQGVPSGHGRRTWPLMAVVIMVVVTVGLAGAIVWLMASTVPTGDYDDAISDLEAATSNVTELAQENADLSADVASLSEERDQLLSNVAAAAVAAKTMAYLDLNFDPISLDEMAQAGVDFASYDELLAQLGEDATMTEWVASNDAFMAAEWSVYQTDDTQLIEAWNAWLGVEPGTVDDMAAYFEILVRLDQLINEQLSINEPAVLTNTDAG